MQTFEIILLKMSLMLIP